MTFEVKLHMIKNWFYVRLAFIQKFIFENKDIKKVDFLILPFVTFNEL